MYNYICETPEVLTHIIDNRKEITHEFVEEFKDKDIEQIYVIGSVLHIMRDFQQRTI